MDTVATEELGRPRKGSRLVRVALLLIGGVGLISLVLLHGTATPARSETAPASSQANRVDTPIDADVAELVVAGIPQPFVAGGEIPIAGDVLGAMTIDRGSGDKRYSRSLALGLFHRTTSDEPIDDAAVQLTAHMRHMDHGTFRAIGTPAGAGGYLVSLPFPMPGEWQLEVEIRVPGLPMRTLQLNLTLLD